MKKKILILTNSLSGGGAEDSAFQVYQRLDKYGLNVKLCVINTVEGESIPDEIYSISREWKSGVLATIMSIKHFKNLFRVLKPEILIIHCELPELFAASLFDRRVKIYCVEHTSRPWHGRKILGMLVRSLLKFLNTHWVTVSSTAPRIWFGDKFPIYIANPSKKSNSGLDKKQEKGIVFIGRLRKEKRPNWAIEAAVTNKYSITLYGDGEELENLKNEFHQDLQLINFMGYIKNPWNEINKDSLIIVSSEFEGDGLVVVEGILNGNPLLLADNRDLRRFNLPNQNYFKTKKDLIEKIKSTNQGKFLQFTVPEQIRCRLEAEREIESVASKWIEILQ